MDRYNDQDELNVSGEAQPDQTEISMLLAATVPQVDESFKQQLDARLADALEKRRSLPQQTAQPAQRSYAEPAHQQTKAIGRPPILAPVRPRRFSWIGSVVTGAVGVALLLLLFFGMSALLRSRQQPPGSPLGPGVVPATAIATATPAVAAVVNSPTQAPRQATPLPTDSPVPATPVPPTQPAPTDTSLPPVYSAGGQSANPPNLTHIDMVDANIGWGLSNDGDSSDTYLPHNIVRTTDGGRTWTKATPAGATSDTVILAMHFLDANTGWLATIDQQQQPQGTPMAVALHGTTDGGRAWSSANVPFDYTFVTLYPFVSLDFLDANHGWMTIYGPGGMSTTPGQLFTTTDGGKSWTELANTANTGGQLSGQTLAAGQMPFGGVIHFHNATTGWLVGSMAGTDVHHLYITQDGGRTWSEQALTPANTAQPPDRINVLAPPVFFSDTDGVVTAMEIPDSQEAAKFSTIIYTTSDGGKSWKSTTSIPSSDAAFAFLNSQQWWIWGSAPRDTNSVSPVDGKLYRTNNGDQAWKGATVTWTTLTPGPGDPLVSALQSGYNVTQLDFVSTYVGWAVLTPLVDPTTKPYLLLKTTDGGQTWAK
jgi:photosystem II stability/assembly factor-like uncharacterized protein